MTSRIRTTEELRDALKQKLNELKDAFKADAVTLHLYDPQRERLYFPVSINLFQEQRFLQGAPSMERGTGKIVRTRLPIIADDAEHHPDLTGPFTHVEKVKAAAGFPLLDPDSGEVMGVLFVDHRRPHQFEKDEIERIQSQISELAEFIGWCLQGDQGQMLRGALQMETDLRLEEARLQDIINRLWNVLGDVDIALWTRERGKRDLRIQMHRGLDRNFADRVSVNLDTDSSNIIAVAFVGGEEVLIESPQTDPRAIFNIDTSVAWERVLAVPVFSEYHRLGVLTIFRRERLGFTRRERDTVSAFANLIAVTVESENRIIALNALHDVGVRLTLVTDLSDILHEVVRSACQVIGADVATIHLYDPARQAFRDLEHSAVFPAQARPDVEKPLAKGGLSARIVEQGRIYCEDVDAQPDRTALSTFVEKQGIKAYVGTRLISIDEPLGVLYVSFREKRRFSPEDLALIQILANYASTAIYRTELLNQRAAVTEIGSEIASKLDRDELLQTILERSVHLLKCRDGSIALFDKSTGELVFQHAVGEQQWERLGPGEGLTGAAVQSRRPVRVGDVTKDPRYVEHVLETRSELDVPLLVGDELIGVLNVESPRYNAFSEEDERLAMTLASQAAVALYNAELFQRTQEQLEQRKALHEIARDITSVLKVDELLNKILERSLELLRCPVGSITLLNRATGELEFHYAIGKQVGMRLPVDKGLMTMAAQTRKPVRVGDVTEKPWRTRYVEHVAETRSELDVPLLVGDELIGVLNAESPRYNAFSEDDERLAMTLASQAAVALYNAMLFEQRNALVEFGQAVTSEIRLREDEVLDLIYEQASQLMDTDNMYIALYDEAIDTVRFGLAFVNGRRVDVETEEGWQPRRAGKGRTEEIIRTKKPLFHATKAEAEEWYSQPEHQEYIGEPFASWLGVPMMVGERVLGVIAVYHPKRDHVYSGDDLSILQAMANQAAIALDNAHMFYDVNRRLTALLEFGQKVASSIRLPEDEALELIHAQASKLMDTNNMYIALYDEVTDTVRFGLAYVNGRCIDVGTEKGWEPRRAGKGKTEEIISTRQPIFTATKEEAKAWYAQPEHEEYIRKEIWASWLGVPMMVGDKVLGVIATYHPTLDYVYSGDDLTILQAMASQAAVALDNAWLYEEARRLQDEVVAGKQLATLGTAMAALQHRINNTFNIIVPNVTRLRKRVDMTDRTLVEILDIIERNARYTSDIIARIQEPLREVEVQDVNVNAVLTDVVGRVSEQWRADPTRPTIEDRLDLDASLPQIRAPIGQIAEVFYNLVDNAYRATKVGGQLVVTSRLTDSKICVRVQDTGPGIPPQVQQRLFVKPVPSKEPGGGAGLGLWLSRLILQSIGGNVIIEKSDPTGTTMLVQIPALGAGKEVQL